MPSLRDIRRRIRSVRNIGQITKAMEMVAASRMRRAQARVVAARPYAAALRAMLGDLAAQRRGAEVTHPLLEVRPLRRVGLVLLTSDRGLAGPLNSNLIRRAGEFILTSEHEVELLTIGRKGQDFFIRRGRRLIATFTGLGDRPDYTEIQPIARVLIESFTSGGVDAAYLLYPRYVSTLQQVPTLDQVLPITAAAVAGRQEGALEYIYEPDPQTILKELLPRYVEVQLYQAVLETIASEHSARMIAMRNATDNARELVASLTLSYNKARQASITKEITEIASAAEAISGER